ncbi:MAG: two-component sensor histidine kinase, partial [Betaproteobacteria bacterium HGW-Betaproteobacteria-19]
MQVPRFLRPPLAYFLGSVRAKLLFLVLAPLMLGFPIIMGLTWYWSHTYYNKLLVFKVGSDLVTANEYFDRVVEGVGIRVSGIATSRQLAQALAEGGSEGLLKAAQGELGLDFINVLDVNGR